MTNPNTINVSINTYLFYDLKAKDGTMPTVHHSSDLRYLPHRQGIESIEILPGASLALTGHFDHMGLESHSGLRIVGTNRRAFDNP